MENHVSEDLNTTLAKSSSKYHEDIQDYMPTWGYATAAFILFLIGFFGFFLNLLAIILMCKDKQLWTPLNLILLNLVCSDFSVSIIGNPFTLISALYHYWVFGKTMCVMYGFFMALLGITSITTLTVLSFERYIMVSKPLASHKLSMRGASISIFLIWCYSFTITSPPLFGWGSYVNEAANISCTINWKEQSWNALSYILFLFAMGLVIPVMIITFSYLNILKTIKSNACRMGKVGKRESQITLMVFLMIVTFMITWTPYSIFALLEQFAPANIISPALGIVPALVAKSSICYNPIIYVGMNTQFRASVKRILGFGDGENSVQGKILENTLMSPSKLNSQNATNSIMLQNMRPINISSNDEELPNHARIKDDKNRIKKTKKKHNLTKNSLIEEQSSELSTDKETANRIDLVTSFATQTVRYNKSEVENEFEDQTASTSTSKVKCVKFESNEFLLKPESVNGNRMQGEDNMASEFWDDSDLKVMIDDDSDYRHLTYSEPGYSKMMMPTRRKTLAYTNFNEDLTEMSKMKFTANRRKSTTIGFNCGGSKKFSTTLHDVKGVTITKLMVDERDRSKLMAFEKHRLKSTFEQFQSNEEMM